jgi:hypothetical protein
VADQVLIVGAGQQNKRACHFATSPPKLSQAIIAWRDDGQSEAAAWHVSNGVRSTPKVPEASVVGCCWRMMSAMRWPSPPQDQAGCGAIVSACVKPFTRPQVAAR